MSRYGGYGGYGGYSGEDSIAKLLRDTMDEYPEMKKLYESEPSLSTQLFQRNDGKWENIDGVIFEKAKDGTLKMVSDPTSKAAYNMSIQSMISSIAPMSDKNDIDYLRKMGAEAAEKMSESAVKKKKAEEDEKKLEEEQHQLYEAEQQRKRLALKEHPKATMDDKANEKHDELKKLRDDNLKKSRNL
jgi:hypothetical protein